VIETYLVALIGVIAAQASPGPNLFAVASAALGQGRTSALYVTLGVSTGLLVWAVGIAFGPVAAISAFIIYGCYAVLFSTGPADKIYRRFARWIDALFGATFGMLGTALIVDGARELRS